MSDVMDMLGIPPAKAGDNNANNSLQTKKNINSMQSKIKGKKPKGMKREVFDLLGKDGIASSVPAEPQPLQVFKNRRIVASKGRWVYEKINNPARSDNCDSFHHWVRADLQSLEYSYAKFNIKIEPISYTDEEYSAVLSVEAPVNNSCLWSKEETDELIQLCNDYELRWPVIYDRAVLNQNKPLEELIYRYHAVIDRLSLYRRGLLIEDNNGDVNMRYDIEREKTRRKQQDVLFKKTKEEEEEELKIKEELKLVEAAMKKNKKAVKSEPKHNNSANDNSAVTTGSLFDSRGIVQATTTSPTPNALYYAPEPGKPALQSSRLYLTDEGAGLSKQFVAKMHVYLKEAGVPDRPVPTKAVCDMIDTLRKDTISLISLTNAIKKKEKDLLNLKNPGMKTAPKSNAKGKPRAKSKKENGSTAAEVNDGSSTLVSDSNGTLAKNIPPGQLAGLLEVFDSNSAATQQPASSATAPKKRSRSTGTKKANSKSSAATASQLSTTSNVAPIVTADVSANHLSLEELPDADLIDFGLDDSFDGGTHDEPNTKRIKME